MANPVPVGADVSSGTDECTNCGNGEWLAVTGGDAAADPYPESW